jgi:hypothetical protein
VDLTLNYKYPNICGFTVEEFDELFKGHMENALEPMIANNYLPPGATVAELRERILDWYDGYSWDGKTKVLNPWSVLSFFENLMFDNYWYESGTPSFLINLIKERRVTFDIFNHDATTVTNKVNNVDVNNLKPIPLMFQTGYLTVKKIKDGKYHLVLPNLEVKTSFFDDLMSLTSSSESILDLKAHAKSLLDAFVQMNPRAIELSFDRFLSSVNLGVHIPLESYYQTLFLFAMVLADQSVMVEEASGEGFLDVSLKIPKVGVFIIEMKYIKSDDDYSDDKIHEELNKKALEATRQINDRKYASKYCGLGNKVYKVALVVYKRTTVRVTIDEIV